VDALGVEIFGPVQGDEDMISQPPERVEAAVHALQDCDRLDKDRIKQLRLRRIQHVPDLIVGGNPRYIEQGLAIRTCMLVLKPPLMIEKRRALHEKRRKRRHPEIGHPIGRIRPATLVGKPFQASAQRTQ